MYVNCAGRQIWAEHALGAHHNGQEDNEDPPAGTHPLRSKAHHSPAARTNNEPSKGPGAGAPPRRLNHTLLPRRKCNGQICAPCASCAPLPMLRRASPRRAWAQSCSWAQLCSCVAAVRHVLASSAPASPVASASPPVSATQSRSARSVPSSPNGLHLTSWRSSLSREVQAWRRFIYGALSVLCHVIPWHLRKLGQIADSLLWHGIQPK